MRETNHHVSLLYIVNNKLRKEMRIGIELEVTLIKSKYFIKIGKICSFFMNFGFW